MMSGAAGRWTGRIVDVHAHVNGVLAMPIYREAARAFGVTRVVSQVGIADAPRVVEALGDFVRLIAFPSFRAADRVHAMTEGYLEDIGAFHALGARFAKLWNAPRTRELFPGEAGRAMTEFDGEWRLRHARRAASLGMGIMVHVADPDTWFATRYVDQGVYGRKIEHYRGLRVLMDAVPVPFIAAHMGGWPEDLEFLDGLLAAHANLHLDTSATKWVARALSAHEPGRVREFFERWRTRILFGSDIVTIDDHVAPQPPQPPPGATSASPGQAPVAQAARHPMADLADGPEAAFDLYASRYFVLRTLFETRYDGESAIADPDLMMVDPTRYGEMSAPRLRGVDLPPEVLADVYHRNAERLFASVGCPV